LFTCGENQRVRGGRDKDYFEENKKKKREQAIAVLDALGPEMTFVKETKGRDVDTDRTLAVMVQGEETINGRDKLRLSEKKTVGRGGGLIITQKGREGTRTNGRTGGL